MLTQKTCHRCNEIKSIDRFRKQPENLDGYVGICHDCNNTRFKELYTQNPEKYRNKTLKRLYGLDIVKYNDLFTKQQGCCAICFRHQSEFKYTLCVDHDHKTNQVRGLLCNPCNQAIGLLQDSPVITDNATVYLSKKPEGEEH